MARASWGAGLVLAVAAASSAIGGQTAPPPSPPPALTPLQQCEVDRVALQQQVVELRAQLVALQTQIDREALARERTRIEGTLPVTPGQRWDWQRMAFVPASVPEKPAEPK
jgi:hypothetical protein